MEAALQAVRLRPEQKVFEDADKAFTARMQERNQDFENINRQIDELLAQKKDLEQKQRQHELPTT